MVNDCSIKEKRFRSTVDCMEALRFWPSSLKQQAWIHETEVTLPPDAHVNATWSRVNSGIIDTKVFPSFNHSCLQGGGGRGVLCRSTGNKRSRSSWIYRYLCWPVINNNMNAVKQNKKATLSVGCVGPHSSKDSIKFQSWNGHTLLKGQNCIKV